MNFKAYPRVWVDLRTPEVLSAVSQILNPTTACGRSRVADFERAYAGFVGTTGAVAFPNCRSSLFFSLKALDLEPGSEVILPAFTFWVDVAVTLLAGLKPVFVDVCPETMNLDASKIENAVTSKTAVLLPAHLNGLPADMDAIMEIARRHNLRVVEDCARICGGRYRERRVGSFDIGAFSFGYGKSFYGFGGGMVTSNDESFTRRLRSLKSRFKRISRRQLYRSILKGCLLKYANSPLLHRFTLFPAVYRYQINGGRRFASWFQIQKPEYSEIPEGFTVDMFNVQANLGFRQLQTIDSTNQQRKRNMKILNRELSGIPGFRIPPEPADREHVCVHYAIWTEKKRELQEFLLKAGIDAQDESAEDVTRLDRFADYVNSEFPNAARLHHRILYLPTHPCLMDKDMRFIARKVKEFFTAEACRIH